MARRTDARTDDAAARVARGAALPSPAKVAKTRAVRVDLAVKLGSKVRVLNDGTIAVPAKFTRSGVLEYCDETGAPHNEYRPIEEVFSAESLASFAGVAVTLLHPEEMVTPESWPSVAVGHAGDDVRQGGEYGEVTLYVKRADAIASVLSGESVECSAGYFCDVIEESGVGHDGIGYIARQTNIRGNHIAIGPVNWGRAGGNVRMYMDAREPRSKSNARKDQEMDEAKKKALGEALAQAIAALQSAAQMIANEGGEPPAEGAAAPSSEAPAADAKAPPFGKEGDDEDEEKEEPSKDVKADAATTAKADAARDAAKIKATQEAAGEKFDSAVAEAVEIRDRARALGLTEASGTNREIMVNAIKLSRPSFDAANRPDAYVRAYFDSVYEATVAAKSASEDRAESEAAMDAIFGKIVESSGGDKKTDAAHEDPYQAMIARQIERNKRPAA